MTFAEAFNPIRALKSTFEAMNLQPGHLWGGALLLIFVESITGIGFQFISPVVAGGGEQAVVFLFCGACVAACPNASASLFVGASTLSRRPNTVSGKMTRPYSDCL